MVRARDAEDEADRKGLANNQMQPTRCVTIGSARLIWRRYADTINRVNRSHEL